MADVRTVMWKEFKELLQYRGNMRGGTVGLLVFVVVFGIFLPLQFGRRWVESPISLIYWAWVPLFLVASVIADSFAGERERHTLETLLASRLSDRAILFGKVAAAVGYGWGLTMFGLILGLVTVNVTHSGSGLVLYPAATGVGILVLSLLTAGLAASAGVLVSLRAASVRQAQQTLSIAVMVLIFVPVFGVQALPQTWQTRLVQAVVGLDVNTMVPVVLLILIVLDGVLLAMAIARFQRARLILD